MDNIPKDKRSFSNKFLSGEAHFGFWDSVSKGIGLLNTFFIVTTLSIYEYGVFQLLLSVYAIFNNFLALGGSVVGNDILRFIGIKDEAKAKRLFFEYNVLRLMIGILAALAMYFGQYFLSRWYAPEALLYLRPMAYLILLEIFFSAFKTILNLRLKFGLVASRATVYKIAQLTVLSYYFFFRHIGVEEVIYSMIAGSVLSSLLLLRPVLQSYALWRGLPISQGFLIFKIFGAHGKWEIFQQFFSKLTASLQPWVIKTFVSTEAVAVYSIAQTMVSSFIGFFPNKTLGTLIPLQAHDPVRVQKIYTYAVKYLFLLAVVFGVGAAFLGPLVIYFVFPKYVLSLPYFFILLLGLPISAVSSVTSTFLVVMRKQKYLFYQKVLKGLTFIPMFFLIMYFGLAGLAFYQIVFAFVLSWSAYRFLKSVPP